MFAMYKALCLFLLVLTSSISFAQSGIVCTGASTSNTSGSMSSSIGQIARKNSIGTSYSTCEGIQQPEQLLSGIRPSEQTFKVAVFPNPASDVIKVTLTTSASGPFDYQLLDTQGRCLKSGKIKNGIH